jgi:DNA polymerase-3 subunit beta
MNTVCTLQKIQEAVSIAERVVGKKESLPVLSCVLIEAKANTLYIRATNLESGVEVKLAADVKEEGICAVPVSVLSPTLKSIRSEKITLELSAGNLTITSKHGTTTIKTIPPDEFPTIPKETAKVTHTIPVKTFIEGIQSVSYAASQSLIRPELASIYISYKSAKLTFVATDSFRLAEKQIQTSLSDEIPDTLIPVKNALELVHILGFVQDENITFNFEESQISADAGHIYVVSRIIDATFPNYREIIPKSASTEATLLREDFQSVLKKARIFSYTSQQVGLHIYPSKKVFSVTARNSDVGETADTIDAALQGEDIDINFNLTYLSDCFQSLHSESITLECSGTGKPLIVRGVGDQSFLYLVMPLNK